MSDSRPDEGENRSLFNKLKRTGSRRYRNALVDAHTGFAYHIARRYKGRGLSDEDLEQVALVGLVNAVDRFDPDYGAAFTTFAGRTIEGELKRYFRDFGWSVRVPGSTKELHLEVRAATDDLRQTLGRSPTVKELATHLDVDSDKILMALGASAAFNVRNLGSTSATDAGDEARPLDRSPRLSERDQDLDTAVDRVLVEELIESLPEREAEIVRLRFFESLTQTQIAEIVGVSQMHVSRLIRRALVLMRQEAEGR